MLRVLSRIAIVGLVLSAQAVLAQEALDAVGPDAAVVVRLKAPKSTTNKVAEFAGAIDPGLSQAVKQQSLAIGQVIHNLTLDGVDQSADWWVAVYPPADGDNDPVSAFIIPATDLAAMKDAIPEEFTFLEHGKFGVYTKDEAVATRIKDLIGKKGDSIRKAFDAPSKAVFDKGDLSVFVNVAELVTRYKDQLEELRNAAESQIQNMPVQPGVDPEAMTRIVNMMLEGFFQGIGDSQNFTLAMNISGSGLTFEELLRVKNGSKFDDLLQKSPPSAMEKLASLPPGSQGYLGTAFNMKGLLELSSQVISAVPDEKTQQALKNALTELKTLNYGPSVGALKITPAPEGVLSTVQISQITPTDKFREISRKMLAAQGEVKQQGLKQITKLETEKETYGNYKADVVTMKYEPDDDADPATAGLIENFMSIAFGSEGLTQRLVYTSDSVVQTMGGGKELMQTTLDSLKNSASPTSPVSQARKPLGAKSNLLILMDLPNLVISIGKSVTETGAFEAFLPAETFDGLSADENFLGISATTEPQGLRFMTVIPVEQVQGLAKIGMKIQSMRQNR